MICLKSEADVLGISKSCRVVRRARGGMELGLEVGGDVRSHGGGLLGEAGEWVSCGLPENFLEEGRSGVSQGGDVLRVPAGQLVIL